MQYSTQSNTQRNSSMLVENSPGQISDALPSGYPFCPTQQLQHFEIKVQSEKMLSVYGAIGRISKRYYTRRQHPFIGLAKRNSTSVDSLDTITIHWVYWTPRKSKKKNSIFKFAKWKRLAQGTPGYNHVRPHFQKIVHNGNNIKNTGNIVPRAICPSSMTDIPII